MSLTNIAALFSDIVETPQQRQQRLLAEGQASAAQFTGLPTGIRELAMGIGSNIPRNVEAVRRLGVQAGLPMQTQGEQLQGAMANFNIDDPNSRMAVLNQLRAIDPMRAVAFGEMLKERDAAETERKLMKDLREREMAVAEGRLAVSEQQADTAAADLGFRTTQQQDLQEWRRLTDENADLDRVIDENRLATQVELNRLKREELGRGAIAFTNELQKEANELKQDGVAAQSLAREFEANAENLSAGALAAIEERWKAFMGNENRQTELRQRYTRIRNEAALGGLPPGAASDKDVEVVMSGFPSDTASPELIASWLRGVEKMSFIASERANAHLQFIAENRGMSAMIDSETGEATTFNDFWRNKVNENEGQDFIETMNIKYGNQGLNILSAEEQQALDAQAQELLRVEADNQRRMEEQRAQQESEDEALRRLGRQFTPGV